MMVRIMLQDLDIGWGGRPADFVLNGWIEYRKLPKIKRYPSRMMSPRLKIMPMPNRKPTAAYS